MSRRWTSVIVAYANANDRASMCLSSSVMSKIGASLNCHSRAPSAKKLFERQSFVTVGVASVWRRNGNSTLGSPFTAATVVADDSTLDDTGHVTPRFVTSLQLERFDRTLILR